jgi:Baseplate J-like protein
MAGRIIYLEIDDEITSAAARIRASEASRLAIVLPYGSRVSTSRINFRLLSRDALTHEKRLSIVAADPATRALAASAGLPVFSSVAEYEASLAGIDEPGEGGAGGAVGPAAAVVAAATVADAPEVEPVGEATASVEPPAETDGTLGLIGPEAADVGAADAAAAVTAAPVAAAPVAAAGSAAPHGETVRTPVPRPVPPPEGGPIEPGTRPVTPATGSVVRGGGRGGVRTPWLIGGAILALAILIAGVGAYLLLPSATIVVTPRPEPVGPIEVTVVADPAAAAPDPVAGVVPAEVVTLPVAVDGTFNATGKRVELTRATGTVRFENRDPTSSNRIAAGSVVRTGSGIRFRTNADITVPKAELVGLTIFPARASVKVTATDGGPEGNVAAGTIVIVPNDENGLFLKVTNLEPTTGGSRQEFTRITQGDVDAALASLNASLQVAFADAMADPALAAGGATVFPSTGKLGEPAPTVPPESLVGQEVTTFQLGLSATGTVVTADTAPVTAIAETKLRAAVKPDHELVEGSVDIEVGEAIIVGQTVSFPVMVSAEEVAILDPDELTQMVLGKPVPEARAILAPYGEVEITVWPEWAGSIPSFESRVDLSVDKAVEIETPAPSGSATP